MALFPDESYDNNNNNNNNNNNDNNNNSNNNNNNNNNNNRTLQSRQIRKINIEGQINKYQDLRLQVQKFWNIKATVIPVVVGALGTVNEELENHLKITGIPIIVSCLQRVAC